MRWGVLWIALVVGCGGEEPAPTESTPNEPAAKQGPAPATLQARGAASAAREEWQAFLEENDAAEPPVAKVAAAAWERAEGVEDDDQAARDAYEAARRGYREALDAARGEQAAAAEKLYLATVDARGRARALRQRVADVIDEANRRSEQTADVEEAKIALLVCQHLETSVFPSADRVTIDTDLEKANVFFEDKRYGTAKEAYERIAADLEKRLERCEEAEPFVRAARAAGLARAELELSRQWLRERNVPEPAAMKDGAAAIDAGDERLDARDWDAARAEFERAVTLFKRAVADGAVLIAALEEATKTQRAAAEARARWQAYAADQGIEATNESKLAEKAWSKAEWQLGEENYGEAATLFRSAGAGFDAAIKAHMRLSVEALRAKRQGSPPMPGGRYPSRLTQLAVGRGLLWLANHQDIEGHGNWDCDGFMKHDPEDDKCDGPGQALFDVGVTGLALYAFLRADHLDRGDDEMAYYAFHVRRGLDYLRAAQAKDGVYGPRASHYFMYNHAIATLAMTEAYRRTKDKRYGASAQAALTFIAQAQSRPENGPPLGWRYEPRGVESDTSITAWCLTALHAGADAGLAVELEQADAGARKWVEKVTDPNFAQVGYNYPGGPSSRIVSAQERWPTERTQAMTAAGIHIRVLTGQDPRTSEIMRKGLDLCLELPPVWNPDNGSIDMYYWYYGTLAVKALGGTPWRKWSDALRDTLITHQYVRGSGTRAGSWAPLGPWGEEGGTVYMTALAVLALQETRR